MDYDGLRGEDESERTDNVTDYKRTCIDFIEDISGSYLEWVDYYKLPKDEDTKRRKEIASIIERTNTWLAKIPQSLKAVDVVINYGIQKMAEATGKAFFDETNLSEDEFDLMDINLKLNAQECKQRDVISFTIIVSEMKDGVEFDRRGLSTVVHIV